MKNATTSSLDQSATFDQDFTEYLVQMLAHHKHIFVEEQQTGHRSCAWCSACDEPGCSHYWDK